MKHHQRTVETDTHMQITAKGGNAAVRLSAWGDAHVYGGKPQRVHDHVGGPRAAPASTICKDTSRLLSTPPVLQ